MTYYKYYINFALRSLTNNISTMKRVCINGKSQTKADLIQLINYVTKSSNPYYYKLTYADILSVCKQVGIDKHFDKE